MLRLGRRTADVMFVSHGLGNLIVLLPMVLNAHAGTKYGIPFPVYCRAPFGILGRHQALARSSKLLDQPDVRKHQARLRGDVGDQPLAGG